MRDELEVTSDPIDYRETPDVVADVIGIIESAQAVAHRAVDTALVYRNWLIGMRIVNEELKDGERKEVYGRKVVPRLASELTAKYGKGYSRTSLYQYVKFYRMFPEIVHVPSGQSRARLSWTHYRELLRVEDPSARAWYEHEAAEQMWSVSTLSRNISTQWYHRLLANHADMDSIPNVGMSASQAYAEWLAYIKSPVIGEFLGLSEDPSLHESELEDAIISHLQRFLLEMGKGYAFVARQEHVRTEWKDFYIDLVFYNFVLKCFVLIDLKVGDFVQKARTNSVGNLRAIFGDVMMKALAAILGDSQDMYETFSENPDAYMRIMNNDLLPVVYRRCNSDEEQG